MTDRPVRQRALSVVVSLLTPAVALLLLIPTVAIVLMTSSVASTPSTGVQEALAQPLNGQNAITQRGTTRRPPAPADARASDTSAATSTQDAAPVPETTAVDPELLVTPPRSLYLSIGHGLRPDGRLDPGTIHPVTGEREVDAGAVIVQAMTDVLQQAPNLTLWAQSDNHPDVNGTVRAANQKRADDCIEIHQDWSRAPAGVFAHWHPSSNGAKQLADQLVGSLGGEGNAIRDDWHKARAGLWFLRGTSCRAVLVEVGRVGDYNDEELARFGRAMALAYLEELRSQDGDARGSQNGQGEDRRDQRGAKNRTEGSEGRDGRSRANEAGRP